MKFAVAIVIIVGLLLLWRMAWRTRPILAFGITLGIMISWIFAVVVGSPSFEKVPIWLPPLPFATVAVTLLVFGVLAWVWDDGASGDGRSGDAGSPHSH